MDNDRNQEMVIIKNIMKDLIEVKYEDEYTTHNHQVSVDLLKMTTQYVNFLGIENYVLHQTPQLETNSSLSSSLKSEIFHSK